MSGRAGWALLLDFDGTLVDIAESPGAVVVPGDLPGHLDRLRGRLGGALAIVTGRTVADLDDFLPGLALDVCGMHGLERRIGGVLTRPEGLADLGPEIEALKARLAAFPGVLVEDKRIGVAVHWRMAPTAEAEAVAALDDLARRLGPAYREQDGKAVREIVPVGAGKGGAVHALMAAAPYLGRRPAFVGDDRTDEAAFAAAQALGGLAVKVGPGPTGAGYRLASAAAVRSWLGRLADGDELRPDGLPAA